MPPPAPSREEVEVRKLDALLALTDAKISIVTVVPGQQAAGKQVVRSGSAGAPDGELTGTE